MAELAIELDRVGKLYRIGQRERYRTLRDTLTEAFTKPLRWLVSSETTSSEEDTLWALKDISLEIAQSEVVGIIGRNGAGKSTLLKILARVTDPTCGRGVVRGRIGSLLEVGTGFHPELTGRENIYLNGAVLGMRRSEITSKFDEIVAFAETERFLDTPVKHYSSGMYLRLAFAVAAHLEPEILLVDEVLAVGDASFQRKCLGKMGEVAKQGRTVLLVSHNMSAVRHLCKKAVWIDEGLIRGVGGPEEIIRSYLIGGEAGSGECSWDDPRRAPGDEHARLRAVRIRTSDGRITSRVDIRNPFDVEIEYELHRALRNLRVGMRISTADGTVVFTSADMSGCAPDSDERPPGRYVSRCSIPGNLLNEGTYSIFNVWVDVPFVKVCFLADNPLSLSVEQTGGVSGRFGERWSGVICPDLCWTSTRLA